MQPESAAPEGSRSLDWSAITQLVLSGLGVALAWLGGGFVLLMGMIVQFGETTQSQNASALFATGWIGLFCGLAAVPSAVFSLQRLLGRPLFPRITSFQANPLKIFSLLLLAWPLVLLLGNLVAQESSLAWLLQPPLVILAIVIPAGWFLALAARKLFTGSRQRGWGLFNLSIFVTTPTLMVVEIAAILVIVVIFAIWLTTQPELLDTFERLARRLNNSPGSAEAILQILLPYLRNPWVIFGALAVTAGLAPLIEELLKPLAIWLIAGKRPSPAEGFMAGAICGAGFGVIESMLYLANPTGGGSWAVLAVGRTGTVLLHITTTALVGWGMALAWRNGAYLRLIGAYLAASALHGLWNGFALLAGFGAVLQDPPENVRVVYELAQLAPFGISVLFVALFGLLLWSNRSLRETNRPVSPPAAPAAGGMQPPLS